jgi:thiamine-monophosphate kinase
MISEFELIRRYFTKAAGKYTRLGIGDDCALIKVNEGMELALSTDMLVSGTHFFSDVSASQLGHKVLAVNLSDMAAMGGQPRWCTLAAALPEANETWVAAFAEGFFALADRFEVDLIGGDTTKGPLNFCVQIMGEVRTGKALLRGGAKVEDDIWVSGELGGAALMLKHLQGQILLSEELVQQCAKRLHTPEPRVALGLKLINIANSCIDVSDGLIADLGHILERSQVGAELWLGAIPSPLIPDIDSLELYQCMLAGGDDYELCFTAAKDKRALIDDISSSLKLRLSRIGIIKRESGLVVKDHQQNVVELAIKGFDHFG